MESDNGRADVRWRLGVAIEHLGDKPVDAISAGDIDDMAMRCSASAMRSTTELPCARR
jgi:hypothetical protein